MKLFIQSLVLIISFAIIYIWQKTPLSEYTIPALGFLVFLFILTSARKKKISAVGSFTKSESTLIFTLNTVIFLLIFSTGGFSSSLFFILYFLGFGIAFIFEPQTVFVFTLGAFLIFLPEALRDNVTDNLLRIPSPIFLAKAIGKKKNSNLISRIWKKEQRTPQTQSLPMSKKFLKMKRKT